MADFALYTNNPMVSEYYKENYNCRVQWIGAPVIDVLTTARGFIHKGAELISHPLSGAVKPGLNPYKSLLFYEPDENSQLNFQSVKLIEDAIAQYRKNAKSRFINYNDQTLKDFQTLDLDMIISAYTNIH